MPSTFTLAGPRGTGKRKSKSKLAPGECKCVVSGKRRTKLCRTADGRKHKFVKGGC